MFPYVHANKNGQGQNDYDGLAKHPPRPSEQRELLKKKIFHFNPKISHLQGNSLTQAC